MKKSTKKSTPKKAAKTAATPRAQRKLASEPKPERKPAADPRASGGKPKRLSALDAAARVLARAGKPMRAQELIAAMAEQGLWTSPGGKTPHATLYAAMLREARKRGDSARFRKADRGQFEFNAPKTEE